MTKDEEQVSRLVDSLSRDVLKNEENIRKLVQSIQAMREQYLVAVKNQHLLETEPRSNLELLRTEEVLVSLGLITLEEVKNPKLLESRAHSEEEVSKILRDILAGPNEGARNYLEQFASSYLV